MHWGTWSCYFWKLKKNYKKAINYKVAKCNKLQPLQKADNGNEKGEREEGGIYIICHHWPQTSAQLAKSAGNIWVFQSPHKQQGSEASWEWVSFRGTCPPSAQTQDSSLKWAVFPASAIPWRNHSAPGWRPTAPCFAETKTHQSAKARGMGCNQVLAHSGRRGINVLWLSHQ